MGVKINYKGRCGNNIFQYVTARIFAEKNKLNICDLKCDLLKPKKYNHINNQTTVRSANLKNNSFVNDEIPFHGSDIEYIFDDFFQNSNYINNNKDLIKNFFELPKVEKNFKDIVLHIRLDDFLHANNLNKPENWNNSEVIHPQYYLSILEKETYEKVYIVVDSIKYDWEREYLSNFNKYEPIIVSKTPQEDFHFIRSFNKIINSNSTFSYWASFLSEAEKIYTFKKTGFFGKENKSHGPHVKNLCDIKNQSIIIDENFYFNE